MDIAVFKSLYTTDDTDMFLYKLEKLKNSLYTDKVNLNHSIARLFSREETNYLLKVLPLSLQTDKHISAVIQVIEKIIEVHKKIPYVTLKVSHALSISFIEETCEWFRNEIHTLLLLNIIIDRNIIGGVIIEYKGKYKDLSVKKKIHDYLK